MDLNASLRASAGLDCGQLERLLALGADPNVCDKMGMSALAVAARAGRADCVQALLLAGADPDRADDSGHTPLMVAAFASVGTSGRECRELLCAASDFEKQARVGGGSFGGLPGWGVCFLGSEALETYLPKRPEAMPSCGWEGGVAEALAQGRQDLAEAIREKALRAISQIEASALRQALRQESLGGLEAPKSPRL